MVTAVLTTGAWQVRKRFQRLILYPSHVAKLENHCATLTGFLGASQADPGLSKEVGEVRGDFNSLRPYLEGQQKQTLREATEALENYSTRQSEENLRKLSEKMYQLLREMQNLSDGMKY